MTIAISPIPAQIAYVAPALTLTTANATGSAPSAIRSDADVLVYDVTVPVTQAFGDAAATGAGATAARRSHVHGMPSDADVVAAAEADTTFAHAGGMSLSGAVAASSGINFPAAQSAQAGVNNLDDYEEGSFTPGLADASLDPTGEGQGYSVQIGRYVKIGNTVWVGVVLGVSNLGTLTTGARCRIMGLPFTSHSTGESGLFLFGYTSAAITAGQTPTFQIPANQVYANVNEIGNTTGVNDLTIAEWSTGGRFDFSGTYEVAT